MKILYIRPYEGEQEIVRASLPEVEWVFANEVADVSAEILHEIQVLSVFVDYQVTKNVFELLPNLKMIATRSAGYDHIDMSEAVSRQVIVSRVPHYGARTVAEYAIALMFALSRNAFRSYTDLRQNTDIVQFEAYEGFDLYGKTLGVVGTGVIGRSVCQIARGIGMNVVAFDVSPDSGFAQQHAVTYLSLDEVLRGSDIVTLHVPSNPQTFHLLNDEKLALMKSGSYLVNTARGEVVDTQALVRVLTSGHLAGAALDVLEGEHELREEAELLAAGKADPELWKTLVADHSLIDMPNVIVTPHIAFNTVEAKREITEITLANVSQFIAGEPQNTVTHV